MKSYEFLFYDEMRDRDIVLMYLAKITELADLSEYIKTRPKVMMLIKRLIKEEK